MTKVRRFGRVEHEWLKHDGFGARGNVLRDCMRARQSREERERESGDEVSHKSVFRSGEERRVDAFISWL